jgi:hypothetical protein
MKSFDTEDPTPPATLNRCKLTAEQAREYMALPSVVNVLHYMHEEASIGRGTMLWTAFIASLMCSREPSAYR